MSADVRLPIGDSMTRNMLTIQAGEANDAHNLIKWRRYLKHYGSEETVKTLLELLGKLDIMNDALCRSK